MDSAEFRQFKSSFTELKAEPPPQSREADRRKSLHVKWANLPTPDHETGSIVYSSPSRVKCKDFNHSAYSVNARRRSARLDALRDEQWSFEHQSEYGKRRDGSESAPEFEEIQWIDSPHPGMRIPVDVFEGESVSPRSSTVLVPMWCTDMDAAMFRARVQPSRGTGRRRPGMTAHSARLPRTAKEVRKNGSEVEEDLCRVQ